MTDIDLDAPPATTRREMLIQAEAELHMVVNCGGLEQIKDGMDRNHIRRAYELIQMIRKESMP